MAGARLLPAARPHQAALGAVARPGPDAQPLRAASPRPTTRSSTASPASTSPRCSSTSSRCPSRPSRDHDWVPEPEPSAAELARQGRRGRRRGAAAARCGASSRRSSIPRATAARRSPRRPRRSARSAGTSPTRRPSVPLNVADRLAPALRLGARRPRAVQADQGRARRHRQRRRARGRQRRAARAGCTPAASAPRASSCGRWCRSRSAPRTSAASSATRSPRCAARCPVYVEDPVAAARDRAARRWRASSSPSRRSAPR